jgi:hypothetical protein
MSSVNFRDRDDTCIVERVRQHQWPIITPADDRRLLPAQAFDGLGCRSGASPGGRQRRHPEDPRPIGAPENDGDEARSFSAKILLKRTSSLSDLVEQNHFGNDGRRSVL